MAEPSSKVLGSLIYTQRGRPPCLRATAITKSVTQYSHISPRILTTHREWWNSTINNIIQYVCRNSPEIDVIRNENDGTMLVLLCWSSDTARYHCFFAKRGSHPTPSLRGGLLGVPLPHRTQPLRKTMEQIQRPGTATLPRHWEGLQVSRFNRRATEAGPTTRRVR